MFGQRKKEKTIAFVVYPGVMPLDLVGAHMVLTTLRLRSRYRTVVLGGHQQYRLGAAAEGENAKRVGDKLRALR